MLDDDQMTDEAVRPTHTAPGTYPCIWNLGDDGAVDGEIVLSASASPSGNARWSVEKPTVLELEDGRREEQSSFPQTGTLPYLKGRIKNSGEDILLGNVSLYTWFSDDTIVDADFALVGHSLFEMMDDGFRTANLQVTALDAISGSPPIASTTFPTRNVGSMTWSAEWNENSRQTWVGEQAEICLEYNARATVHDPYRFAVKFTPTLKISLKYGISAERWFEDWCNPLIRIVSAATGGVEGLTYLSFQCDDGSNVTAFTSGISQAPYASNINDVRGAKSAFTTSRDGLSILAMIEGWRSQREAGNPLIEGYNPALLVRRQHPRFRVLLLLQFLEALFGFENRTDLDRQKTIYLEKRNSLIDRLTALRDSELLTTAELRFAKSAIQKSPPQGLDTALRYHFERLPSSNVVDNLSSHALIERVASTLQPATVENALRVIRNQMAHGERDYPVGDLDKLASILNRIVRAIFLELLDCGEEACRRALQE